MKVIDQAIGNGWAAYNADCVQVVKELPSNSIDYAIFSPPFSSLYCYSSSPLDMGNSKDHDEFFAHYEFLAKELFRVLKPGRLMSVHSMLLPTSKQAHGYIGLYDFPGQLRRIHESDGFIFASEVVIRKDPVMAMQRTKALGLLHKQLCKDSSMSRQGVPDYLTTFRKPGENKEPIAGGLTNYVGDRSNAPTPTGNPQKDSINIWQRYAEPTWTDIVTRFESIIPTLNPEQLEVFTQLLYLQLGKEQQVWMDINPSNTLQKDSVREEKDERHICPLQLEVIERAIALWTNPNDLVLSPFMGIGSEGYVSLKMKRRFVGAELKPSYFKQAVANLDAVANADQLDLLDLLQTA